MKIARFLLIFLCFMQIGLSGTIQTGTDTYNRFNIYLPSYRIQGTTFPESWVRPGNELSKMVYTDSTYTKGVWKQWLSPDARSSGYLNLSNNILALYCPYSGNTRWGLGMEWINYNGISPVHKQSFYGNIRSSKMNVSYFRSAGDHSIWLKDISSPVDYNMISQGIKTSYSPDSTFTLKANLLFVNSTYTDTLTYTDDFFSQSLTADYQFSKHISISTDILYRYLYRDDVSYLNPSVRPEIKMMWKHLNISAGAYLSSDRLLPVGHISYGGKNSRLTVFSDVMKPPVYLTSENGQVGLKGSFISKKRKSVAKISGAFVNNMMNTHAGIVHKQLYRIRGNISWMPTDNLAFHSRGYMRHMKNPMKIMYYPETASFSLGAAYSPVLVHGNLILRINPEIRWSLHHNSDAVHFDPRTMLYSMDSGAELISDYFASLKIVARVKTFHIEAETHIPLFAGTSPSDYLYAGHFLSSDFRMGNVFYVGLNASWIWWK